MRQILETLKEKIELNVLFKDLNVSYNENWDTPTAKNIEYAGVNAKVGEPIAKITVYWDKFYDRFSGQWMYRGHWFAKCNREGQLIFNPLEESAEMPRTIKEAVDNFIDFQQEYEKSV